MIGNEVVENIISQYAASVSSKDYIGISEPIRRRGLRERVNPARFNTAVFRNAYAMGKFSANPGLLAECFRRIPLNEEFNTDVRVGYMIAALIERQAQLQQQPNIDLEEQALVEGSLELLNSFVSA